MIDLPQKEQYSFEVIHYGDEIYLNHEKLKKYLWGRGFIDKNIYLANELQNQSMFSIEPKKRQYNLHDHTKQYPVTFGAEVLLRHCLSGFYVAINEKQGIPILQLQKQETSACYFQLISNRSFQSRGNSVTQDSIFTIEHVERKLFISIIREQELKFQQSLISPLLHSKMKEKKQIQMDQTQFFRSNRFSSSVDKIARNEFNERQERKPSAEEYRKSFLKKKQSIVETLPLKTVSTLKRKSSEENLKSSIVQFWNSSEVKQQVEKDQQKESIVGECQEKQDKLILFKKKQNLQKCHADNYEDQWKFVLATKNRKTQYLQNNEFIYFTHSRDNYVLIFDIEKKPFALNYVKQSSQGDVDYLCSSLFKVEIQDKDHVYLKHVLTNQYFPFDRQKEKLELKLIPLMESEKKLYPPFCIEFDKKVLKRQKQTNEQIYDGYWLNKVNKQQVAQIMSLQNVEIEIYLPYLINYLQDFTRRRQQILRQFQIIPFLINDVIPQGKLKAECYKLLFFICKNNSINKKKCLQFIEKILNEKQKQLILDLLTELLGEQSQVFYLEKSIIPKVIESQILNFVEMGKYSISFIRIFRVFCGPDEQPCVRNQNMIFNLFFWGKSGKKNRFMTESVLSSKSDIPPQYKFRIFEDQGEIYFNNTISEVKYEEISPDELLYIRQYYYLLSDCLKNNNYEIIKEFTKEMGLKLLLSLLKKQDLKGPCLSLIYNAYLKPQRTYNPKIFHKDFDKICEKGSLIAFNTSDQSEILLCFLKDQIRQNKNYKSTTYRWLLNILKATIQNGYWKDYSDLIDVSKFEGLHKQSSENKEKHQSYEEKVNDRNLIKSKTMAISIRILLIDIQIGLWISDMVSQIYQDDEFDDKIAEFIRKDRYWKINAKIFKLCSTLNSELMKKALVLFYKIYNLQKLFYKGYDEANLQLKSQMDMEETFTVINESTQGNLSDQYESKLICCCIQDVQIRKLNPESLTKDFISLESIFKYKHVNQAVQNMVSKLGIHSALLSDIQRYSNLRKKQKLEEEEKIYWKLVLLYAMIKNNLKQRDMISQHRKAIISILESEHTNYYIAVDILEQIYRNNRKLIINDTEQLQKICRQISKVLCDNTIITLRHCKLISLLGSFIETGNRKIVENYQIILKNVFDKPTAERIVEICNRQRISKELEDRKNYENIFQILIYDLLKSMGENKLLLQIRKPSNQTINSLLLGIRSSNWNLKSKMYACIDFAKDKKQEKGSNKVFHLLTLTLVDLNMICEVIKRGGENDYFPKQARIYVSNLLKILSAVEMAFSYIQQHQIQQRNSQQDTALLAVKIMERLFMINHLCPLIVNKKIKGFTKYIKFIEQKLKYKYDLISLLQNIDLSDFQSSVIKEERQPLVIQHAKILKEKQGKRNDRDLYEKNKIKAQQELRKKIKWNSRDKESIDLDESQMKQLKQFLVSLSNVNKSDPTMLSDNLKDFLMNFLRTSFLLQFKQEKEDNSVQNFEEKDELTKKQKLVKMQNLLVEYKIPDVICSVLQEPFKERYGLFCSTFKLSIKLLEGGNRNCQNNFLKCFKQDNKNWIFLNIHNIIIQTIKTIEFYYHYKQDPTIKSYEMMLESQEVLKCIEQRKLCCELLCNVFRFLQLLCENDNHEMKEYIYRQIDVENHQKYMSKNFIQIAHLAINDVFAMLSFSIKQLRNFPDSKFAEEIKQNLFQLPLFIIQFLIQVCQIPADQNQLYICKTDFFDLIGKLMDLKKQIDTYQEPTDIFIIEKQNIFFTYQRKLIVLLRSLLEQDSEEIIESLRKKITMNQFKFFIEESFVHGGLEDKEKLALMLQDHILNNYIENVVNVLIIKKALSIEEKFKFDDKTMQLIRQLQKRIKEIQVNFKGHALTIYFPSHPLFDFLGKKTKDFLLDRAVNLNSRKQKLTDFIISRQIIYQDIDNGKNSENLIMNERNMEHMFNTTIFLSYLIIILLVLFYSVGKSGTVLDTYEKQIINGLSVIQCMVATIYTVLWGINRRPMAAKKLKSQYLTRKGEESEDSHPQMQQSKLRLLKAIYIDEPDSIHCVFIFILSLYACFFEVRAYSITLLFIFGSISLLESIFKAIRLTWMQLLFVCLFAVAFSFMFGFLSLNNYISPLYQNQEVDINMDKINEHCNSIPTCISSLYTQKIIGENMNRDGEEYNYGRFISDILYWGFFEILLTNIIAAIIIDKFAEQRNTKERILNQRENRCYICFADRATIERRGQDFMLHKSKIHFIWNYFYYMYSLERLKDITDFTGIEYWIHNQIKTRRIDWLPIDDSLKEEYNIDNIKLLTEKLNILLKKEQQ